MLLQEDEKIYGINYIPEALTEQEEKEYIKKLGEGDVEARQELIKRNLRLVKNIAVKYKNAEIEDLINVGTIGLINAIDHFNPGMNVKISTFATICIRYELNKCYIYNKRHPNFNAVDTKVFDKMEHHEQYEYENKDLFRNVLEILLNELAAKKKICILYKMADYTNEKISQKFNLSNSYIARTVRQARQELKVLVSANCKSKRFNVEIKDNEFYKISFKIPEQKIYYRVQAILAKTKYYSKSNSNDTIEICIGLENEAFELLAEIIQVMEKNF